MGDIDPKRPGFRIDTTGTKRFFPWATSTKMNKYYSKNNQVVQVKKILGTNNKMGAFQIIDKSRSGTHYFAKGHLSPDAAFVYNVMQDATYYFMNVAPQFQSFNNGNWKALEYNTRELGTQLNRDLHVITGTHGMLTYPDRNNNQTPISRFNSTLSLLPSTTGRWYRTLRPTRRLLSLDPMIPMSTPLHWNSVETGVRRWHGLTGTGLR